MVSNWLTSQKAGSEVRKGIEDIIFNSNLPDYEKRKRLYIFISSTLLSWFYPDENKWEAPASFLRKDCRLIESEEACTGTCHWKADAGKCLLHVDATTSLADKPGERDVSTAELFTKRVIDELVRFPNRRKQLRKRGEISKVSTIIQPIRQGDQYIIPESSPTWTNLLRLDWARQIPEEPKYYEEMSREMDDEDQQPPTGIMPPELQRILGEDTPLRVSIPDVPDKSQPLMPFTGILGITLNQLGLADDATSLNKDNLVRYVQATSKPIGMINLIGEPVVQFIRPATGFYDRVSIFVFLPGQTGLLIEEEGEPTVEISLLPEEIQEQWRNSPIVQMKRRLPAIAPVQESKPPLLVGQNPIMARAQRRPLVASAPQEPLVVAAAKPSEITEAKPKRRPQVAPAAAPVQEAKPTRRPQVAAPAEAESPMPPPEAIAPAPKNRNQIRRRPRVAPSVVNTE
jgi:hypothetical protein